MFLWNILKVFTTTCFKELSKWTLCKPSEPETFLEQSDNISKFIKHSSSNDNRMFVQSTLVFKNIIYKSFVEGLKKVFA